MAASPALAPTDIETWTIRKLRTRIIPFIFVLMVIAFIDRINIGFAALTMNRELAITSQQFGFLAGIFFFGYFIFEIPSNLLLHKIGARIWIARILISWGIVAMLTGFSQTALQLYFVRFLLGVAEAGFIPGILLHLTYWFRQREQAQAIASFLTAGPLTSIFGAPVSGLILDHVHWFGVSSWRWLLILEGIPAILGGVLTCFLLPGRSAEARFLTATEKDWITTELAREEQQRLATRGITAGQALKARFSEYSNTTVGTLVMIPYVVGLTAMILVSRGSDHALERRYHAAIPEMVGAIALFLLGTITAVSPFFSTLWCFVVMGVQNFMAPFWSLPTQFLTGFSAAAGIALINSVGNLGGLAGPYATGAIGKWTGSLYGGLAFTGISLLVSAMLALALRKGTEQHAACVGLRWRSNRHIDAFVKEAGSGDHMRSFPLRLLLAFGLCVSAPVALAQGKEQKPETPVEKWTGKTIMLIGAHADDDMLSHGTLAMLQAHGNQVYIVTLTTGNVGTQDPNLSRTQLAQIRRQEELAALGELGIPGEHYINLGYDDGLLEFEDRKAVVENLVRLIRRIRPDVLVAWDPGKNYQRWHKSDHRAASYLAADAARAAMWRLLFEGQITQEGLKEYMIPEYLFFNDYDYEDENTWVDISDFVEKKVNARAKYVSQFGPGWKNYKANLSEAELKQMKDESRKHVQVKDGKPVEGFRYYKGLPDALGK